MATTAPAPPVTMLPYQRQGEIDYARLDFDPHEPVLKPEAMEQEQPLQEFIGLLASRFTDFGRRPDTFLNSNTIICYEPRNLNVRVPPDVYLAFGVDLPSHPATPALSPLGSRQAAGLGVWRSASSSTGPRGRGSEARPLCPHRRPGILALRSE